MPGDDLLRARDLLARTPRRLGEPLHLVDTIGSTNDAAKEAARAGAPHGAAWVAEAQTAGRGRQGRRWHSPLGEGLWMSVLLRTPCPLPRVPQLALAVGLSVRDALAPHVREEPKIKWPNDVWIDGKKVAGVLVEGIVQGARLEALVVGIGINVHNARFPEELAERATSVAIAAREGASIDRGEILVAILERLDHDVELAAARGLVPLAPRLARADALAGRHVFSDAGSDGIAEGIDDDGRLLVRRDDGTLERWSAGEVHLVPGVPGANAG